MKKSTECEIVAINKYFDDVACEFRSQITIDIMGVNEDFHLGKCEVKQ